MKRDISRYYPPGCDREKWSGMAVLGLVAMGFAQLAIYFYRFSSAYDMLNWDNKHTVIINGNVKMAPFSMLAALMSSRCGWRAAMFSIVSAIF